MAVPLRYMRKSSQKKKSLKNILFEPYRLSCPVASKDDEQEISKKLKEVFDSALEANKSSRKNGDHVTKNEIREQLVIGINAVTRALEHDQVRLLLVDGESKPPLLTRHLIGLSALHACPALWIPGLAKLLGRRLGVSSLVALAFKKRREEDDDVFAPLVSFLAERAPENRLPWLDRSPNPETQPDTELHTEPVTVCSGSDVVKDKVKCQRLSENEAETQHPGPLQEGATIQRTLDYSRLYVLKSQSKLFNGKVPNSGLSNQGFLAFAKDSDSEEEEKKIRKKTVKVGKVIKAAKDKKRYYTAAVGKLHNNPDREMQKELKKKKKGKNASKKQTEVV